MVVLVNPRAYLRIIQFFPAQRSTSQYLDLVQAVSQVSHFQRQTGALLIVYSRTVNDYRPVHRQGDQCHLPAGGILDGIVIDIDSGRYVGVLIADIIAGIHDDDILLGIQHFLQFFATDPGYSGCGKAASFWAAASWVAAPEGSAVINNSRTAPVNASVFIVKYFLKLLLLIGG